MDDIKLPDRPKLPSGFREIVAGQMIERFTAQQMFRYAEKYARAAVLADREQLREARDQIIKDRQAIAQYTSQPKPDPVADKLAEALRDCEARLALLVLSGRSKLLDAVAAEKARAALAEYDRQQKGPAP